MLSEMMLASVIHDGLESWTYFTKNTRHRVREPQKVQNRSLGLGMNQNLRGSYERWGEGIQRMH